MHGKLVGVIHCRVDGETAKAVEQAAAKDERNSSDWLRLLIRRELRRLGLIEAKRK